MDIQTFPSSQQDNASHLGFANDVVALPAPAKEAAPTAAGIGNMHDALAKCADNEADSYKIVRSSELTFKKADIDQQRDNVTVAIRETTRTALRRPDKAQAEAAHRIWLLLNAYNTPRPIAQLPINAETAAINKLIAELNANHADDMKLIGLDTWVADLTALNNEFARLADAVVDEKVARPDYTHREARRATDAAWRNYVKVIDAAQLIDGEEPYRDFVAKLNAIVKTYADRLAQHKGRAGSEQETTEKKAEL